MTNPLEEPVGVGGPDNPERQSKTVESNIA
jgi:hypothetical protein